MPSRSEATFCFIPKRLAHTWQRDVLLSSLHREDFSSRCPSVSLDTLNTKSLNFLLGLWQLRENPKLNSHWRFFFVIANSFRTGLAGDALSCLRDNAPEHYLLTGTLSVHTRFHNGNVKTMGSLTDISWLYNHQFDFIQRHIYFHTSMNNIDDVLRSKGNIK